MMKQPMPDHYLIAGCMVLSLRVALEAMLKDMHGDYADLAFVISSLSDALASHTSNAFLAVQSFHPNNH